MATDCFDAEAEARPTIESQINDQAERTAAVLAQALPSSSRRHGYQPRAREHVQLFLTVEVLGIAPATIARADPRHRSVIYRAIERGRRLCERRRKVEESGFSNPS